MGNNSVWGGNKSARDRGLSTGVPETRQVRVLYISRAWRESRCKHFVPGLRTSASNKVEASSHGGSSELKLGGRQVFSSVLKSL